MIAEIRSLHLMSKDKKSGRRKCSQDCGQAANIFIPCMGEQLEHRVYVSIYIRMRRHGRSLPKSPCSNVFKKLASAKLCITACNKRVSTLRR